MKATIYTLIFTFCVFPLFCQHVGIGTMAPESILHLYGDTINGAGTRIIFGDDLLNGRTNAYIGEWGWQTKLDSDILELSGFSGIKFTTGSSSAYTPLEILGDGSIKMPYLTEDSSQDSLAVVKPGGILARRHMSSLPKELPANPSSGDLTYFNGTSWTLLSPGSDGQYLTLSNGLPVWDGNVCNLSLGQMHEGGYIFYLDSTGCHGLVASDFDLGFVVNWNDAITECNNYDHNGFDDWFLPTIKELNLMWENLADPDENGDTNDSYHIGGFYSNFYWANSTEYNNTANAKVKSFSNGDQTNKPKSFAYNVRPARSF